MATIVTRAGKGSPLTHVEVDANFNNLNNDNAETSVVATKVAKTSDTGSAVIPASTQANRDGTPAAGYFRFNTTVGKFEGHNGTIWGSVGGGATGGGSDAVFMENDVTVTTNYTIGTSKNALTAGPITINGGVTVTIPSGSVWTVV
jgi:hypothetical protein